jgi:glutathione S-transferase
LPDDALKNAAARHCMIEIILQIEQAVEPSRDRRRILMAGVYRIFGAEMSPYSVKIRSYFRYKAVPHQWILRNAASQAEYEKYAKMPIIPLVVTPDGAGLQDSTPIIDAIEKLHPEPSIHPDDPVARFISALIEEFGDEWGNKWMFHYRWTREVDQVCSAGRIARMRGPNTGEPEHAALAAQVRARMSDRLWFVGSNAATAPLIETGFLGMLGWLDNHLATRRYLFGGRPAFGDFGLWGQFYELWTDPTAGALIEGRAPHVLDWVHRMLWPRAEGPFEPWAMLAPTLMPILTEQVGGLFMPWTLANAKALAEARDEFSVELGDRVWNQKPQKYHARSLAMLRARYADAPDKIALDPVLQAAGCLAGLRG